MYFCSSVGATVLSPNFPHGINKVFLILFVQNKEICRKMCSQYLLWNSWSDRDSEYCQNKQNTRLNPYFLKSERKSQWRGEP